MEGVGDGPALARDRPLGDLDGLKFPDHVIEVVELAEEGWGVFKRISHQMLRCGLGTSFGVKSQRVYEGGSLRSVRNCTFSDVFPATFM